ncbi:MAG: hypothetical protein ABSH36_03385, partial [Solirubrobacteraceae bacterium]
MAEETDPKPQYTRYRAGRKPPRPVPGAVGVDGPARSRGGSLLEEGRGSPPAGRGGPPAGRGGPPQPRRPGTAAPGARPSWWRRITPKRAVLGLLALLVGWVVLSLVLFLASSHFRRISPPANVAGQLESAGPLLTSANNILV